MSQSPFDLEERTAKFSENIIGLIRKAKINELNRNIISQLIRSATSIGANYCEANESQSKKDFVHKISLCKKECKETKYWLRLFKSVDVALHDDIDFLWKENHELLLIFSKIINTSRSLKLS